MGVDPNPNVVFDDEDVEIASGFMEWTHANSKPKPITLDFGWNEVGAVAIVGLTALVLDFMAFRASELEKRKSALQKQQQHHHHQQQPSLASSSDNVGTNDDANPTSPVPNGHGEAATSYDCTGEQGTKGADGGGGAVGGSKGSGVVEVEVRPAEEAAAAERRGRVQMRRVFVLAAWIACALGFHRLGLPMLARLSATAGLLVAYLPHLLLSSKYRRDWSLGCLMQKSDKRRSVTDMLVWTSLIYILPSVYGLYVHQYGIAMLQLFTTVGSTLFHLTRETKFFNLDNVFATSLLMITLWGFSLAILHGVWWYVAAIGIGGPFAVFCIVRCGMPGLVCRHPSGHGLCRKSNPEYDFFHMLWHLSSGLGTLASIHFFENNFPAKEAGGGWFYYFPDVPVVPAMSLTLSALVNLFGNRAGVMPLA